MADISKPLICIIWYYALQGCVLIALFYRRDFFLKIGMSGNLPK